ncbi:MAG: hypothetical protein O2905_07320 [Proteobacteria bacterium]|nr:hypothetical protein [Pseudomonadota bacterium]
MLRRTPTRIWVALWIAAAVAACTPGAEPAADAGAAPDGAIATGDETYMVPVAGDDACPMYRAWSATKMVAQVIYYRRGDGEFTMSREEACGP